MSTELNPYNFSANTISWLYEKGLENHNETCNMSLFSGELDMPHIGICNRSTLTLVVTCIITFALQFSRHWIWNLMNVHQYNLLSKEEGHRNTENIIIYCFLQLIKSVLWVVVVIIIINANIVVMISFVVADFFSCGYWIWATQRYHQMPLDTKRMINAINKNPEAWANFIKAKQKWYEFKEAQKKLPEELKIDTSQNTPPDTSNIPANTTQKLLDTKRHILNF